MINIKKEFQELREKILRNKKNIELNKQNIDINKENISKLSNG